MACIPSKFKDPKTGLRMVVDGVTGCNRPRCDRCGSDGGCHGTIPDLATTNYLPDIKAAAKEFYDSWLARSFGVRRTPSGKFVPNGRREEWKNRFDDRVMKTGLPPTW
jgi:hypothetical protein